MDSLRGKDLATIGRLCGYGSLELPGDFAPAVLDTKYPDRPAVNCVGKLMAAEKRPIIAAFCGLAKGVKACTAITTDLVLPCFCIQGL